MTRLRLRTAGRLHFGPLAYGPGSGRQFGGLGLMVERPGIVLEASPASEWSASGPLADRALQVAERVGASLAAEGAAPVPLAFRVLEAPAEHVGLGVGTQLTLAVARAVAESAGRGDLDATALARLTGRGLRSGVGLHGFDRGGLIVEGGHPPGGGLAPLLCRMEFPAAWSALVVVPAHAPGRHGAEEIRAFADLAPMPETETDRLCRLVLLGILPAVAEADLEAFGAALSEIQRRVGSWFAPAQGGVFASPDLEAKADWLRGEGLLGVGQSSWGPALYGFTAEGPEWQDALLGRLRDRSGAGDVATWTVASRRGAEAESESLA